MRENIEFNDYLQINAIHYSLLKNIAEKGRFFNTGGDKPPSFSMNLGTVIDDMTLPTELTTSEYFIIKGLPPTASTLILADKIIKYCKENHISLSIIKNDDDTILKLIEDNNLWNKNTKDIKISKYKDNDSFWSYIEGKLTTLPVLSEEKYEKAKELSYILKEHSHTKNIINSGKNQLTYVFNINKDTFKIRIDKLIVDDENKTINGYDLKTGEPYNFQDNFYRFKLYLQQCLYQLGILHYAQLNLPDYKVNPFKFIYISTKSINPYPVVWEMSEKWAEMGWEGFYYKGKYHKGIKELVEEYNFYTDYGTSMDREVRVNKGELKFPLPI